MFRHQNAPFQRVAFEGDTNDVQMQDAEAPHPGEPLGQAGEHFGQPEGYQDSVAHAGNRLVIAIDFGTTFSTVAYVAIEPGRPDFVVQPEHVLCVDHYPDIPAISTSAFLLEVNENVPTELWYVQGEIEDCDSSSNASEADFSGYFSDSSDPVAGPKLDVAHEQLVQKERHHQLLWGYGVHAALLKPGKFNNTGTRVRRFKLMLDYDGHSTKELRRELSGQTRLLKRRKAVACQEQMISDYLEQLLRHAKNRLQATGDLRSDSQVEFVLCVPNLWSEKACRIMHDSMAQAIEASELGRLTQKCIDNLFIVAEPEAAAEFVLSSFLEKGMIRAGETFVMLDAGGGTVDATTYKLTRTNPVRLQQQAIVHGGDTCGSSFLNDAYRVRITERLEGEYLPLPPEISFEDYVDSLVTQWENSDKRSIDVTNRKREPNDTYIPNLGENPEKNFRANTMKWTREEMKGIFDPVLKRVMSVLGTQLEAARLEENGLNVSKVILIGGFSESPSLVQVLRGYLARPQNFNLTDCQIDLLIPEKFRTSAVARGAVLRGLRKEYGPERRSRSSFGFMRTEIHNPLKFPQHKGVRTKEDPDDGFMNVDNTIYWVIQKVSVLLMHLQRVHDWLTVLGRINCCPMYISMT
jgi:hypothetical protein